MIRGEQLIIGELKEIENEKRIAELEKQVKNLEQEIQISKDDNKRLAEELLQYKTPEQRKEGFQRNSLVRLA